MVGFYHRFLRWGLEAELLLCVPGVCACFTAGFAAWCGMSQIFSVHVLHVALWVRSGCSSHRNMLASFSGPLSALGQSKGWVWSLLAGSSSSGVG